MDSSMPTLALRAGTLDDLPQVVAIANACARETIGRDELTVEEYIEEWRDLAIDLAADTRVALLPDGTIAGCVEVWSSAPYVNYWVWGRVDPSRRGQGIGTALMDWAEARVAERLALAPAGTRVVIDTASPNNHGPTSALMHERGFTLVRHSLTMERSLGAEPPAPAWPDGVEVRPMRPGDEPAVYRAADEAFEDHWGYVKAPDEAEHMRIWLHRMTNRPEFDPSLWFLAVDGDQIAGMALCFPARSGDATLGWISTLGVRRPWRRRGLGQALLYHAFGELRRRGCARVGLSVDGQSLTGATRLYERAGMRVVYSDSAFEKELRPGENLATQAVSST